MANHQINITENGTKTLKTAQKYCDRDIDLIVNVPSSGGAQPTQFTNILDLNTTIVKSGYRVTSNGYTATVDGVAIVFPVNAGTHRIRTRGKYTFAYLDYSIYASKAPFPTNTYQSNATPTDSTFSGTQLFGHTAILDGTVLVGIDEYGDNFLDVTITKDCYFGFTVKDLSITFPHGTFIDPIITIDEPIGSGGVV